MLRMRRRHAEIRLRAARCHIFVATIIEHWRESRFEITRLRLLAAKSAAFERERERLFIYVYAHNGYCRELATMPLLHRCCRMVEREAPLQALLLREQACPVSLLLLFEPSARLRRCCVTARCREVTMVSTLRAADAALLLFEPLRRALFTALSMLTLSTPKRLTRLIIERALLLKILRYSARYDDVISLAMARYAIEDTDSTFARALHMRCY